MGWLKDTFVYRPLAFAETAESIAQVHRVLRVGRGDTVAGIASSGDVLLSFLPLEPAQVLGYDFNPVQTAVSRVREELYRRTDVATFQKFFGIVDSSRQERLRIWSELRPHLGDLATTVERLPIETGILDHGMSAWLSRMIDWALKLNLPRPRYERLLARETTRDERLQIYDEWRGAWLNRGVASVFKLGRGLFQHFFFPPAQVANSDYPKRALMDAPGLLKPMFVAGFADNPVVGRHMTRQVPTEHVEYLFGPKAWAGIAGNIDRIRFGTAGIDAALKALPAGSVDAIYLSNAPDYLKKPGLESFVAAVSHAARKGARVFYLSLDTHDPFTIGGVPGPWKLDLELGRREMEELDTVGVYRYLGAGTML